jgi:Glycosyltransferase family 87
LAWFLLIAIALTGWLVVIVPLRADILDNDLMHIYISAIIGGQHGWNHMYSLALQQDLFTALRPHAVFNDGAWNDAAPPYAWLIAPLTLLSPATAVAIWLAISLLSLAACWWIAAPGEGITRALWLLGALAWYPVLYGLSLVQPDLVMILVIAAAWRLSDSGRPYLAGVVLGLSVIKPQLVLVLPLVLLAAGRWRILVPWAAITAIFVLLSLAVLGTDGLSDYRVTLAHQSQMANNRYFTLAYLLGSGALSYLGPAIVVIVAGVGGYLNRHASYARLFTLGVVASMLGATYWHLQDFTVLVVAAWLFWRERPSVPLRLLLLVIAIAGEFAWPLTPLPILVGVAIWFAAMLTTPRTAPSVAPEH